MEQWTIYADGGCAPNPGQGRCGLVVYDARGHVIDRRSTPLGYGTSNIAEWKALLEALHVTNGPPQCHSLTIRMDSRLVVEQANGRWKVKHAGLKPFAVAAAERLQQLRGRGCAVVIEWVPRDENTDADGLTSCHR